MRELVPTPNVAAGPRARWLTDVVGRRWPGSEVRRVGPDDDPPDVDGRPLVVVVQDAGRRDWQRRIVERLARPGASLEAAFEVLAGRN